MEQMVRCPSHPGEILQALYMEPLSLSVEELASTLDIPLHTLEDLLNFKTRITVDLAMRLSQAFSTTPESWLTAQMNYDLWNARQEMQQWESIKKLQPQVD